MFNKETFKDYVFAPVRGSDVRCKLGCSIASSVGPLLRKWDTHPCINFPQSTAVVCITSCFLHRNQ